MLISFYDTHPHELNKYLIFEIRVKFWFFWIIGLKKKNYLHVVYKNPTLANIEKGWIFKIFNFDFYIPIYAWKTYLYNVSKSIQ